MGTAQATPPPPGQPVAPPSGSSGTDWRSKSFDFGSDATKQLITVSTGIIAATVIFSKDLSPIARGLAATAWLVLLISVMCGLLALLTMTGQLAQAANNDALPDLYATQSGIRRFSGGQVVSFLIGMLLLGIFGLVASRVSTPPDTRPIQVNCSVQLPPSPLALAPNSPAPVNTVRSRKRRVVPQPSQSKR